MECVIEKPVMSASFAGEIPMLPPTKEVGVVVIPDEASTAYLPASPRLTAAGPAAKETVYRQSSSSCVEKRKLTANDQSEIA